MPAEEEWPAEGDTTTPKKKNKGQARKNRVLHEGKWISQKKLKQLQEETQQEQASPAMEVIDTEVINVEQPQDKTPQVLQEDNVEKTEETPEEVPADNPKKTEDTPEVVPDDKSKKTEEPQKELEQEPQESPEPVPEAVPEEEQQHKPEKSEDNEEMDVETPENPEKRPEPTEKPEVETPENPEKRSEPPEKSKKRKHQIAGLEIASESEEEEHGEVDPFVPTMEDLNS